MRSTSPRSARDGEGLAAAASAAPGAAVRSCPGWDMNDLVWHVAGVFYFWGRIAETRAQDWKEVVEPERPADGELLPYYREQLARVLDVLRDADPATEVWTWAPQKNVAFIQRRMAQETAVHRWDAEAAAGREFAIEPRLASDGIAEFFDFFTSDGEGDERLDGTVHLHCTDTQGEWLVREDGDHLVVTPEHAKGDAAIRGPASNLLLALWRRVPLETLEVIGDGAVAARLIARTNLE